MREVRKEKPEAVCVAHSKVATKTIRKMAEVVKPRNYNTDHRIKR